jgi:hypothetical protein
MSAPAEMVVPIVPASVCPLCRGSNACVMAAADAAGDSNGATPCWCVAAVIAPAALARASALDGGAACLCAACAAAAS